MAALVQGPPYSGEWTLDTRFHCQAPQWPWKPGSTVKPQPQTPTVTLETKSQDVHVGISIEYISSQEKDADEQFSICDHLWWFGYELSAGNQVSFMHFPPNDFIQKILRQFSRVRLRNKTWKIICNHVSFWARSNFFGRDLKVLVTLIDKKTQ